VTEQAVRRYPLVEPGGFRPDTGQPMTPPQPVPATHYCADLGNSGGAGPGQCGAGGPGPAGLPVLIAPRAADVNRSSGGVERG
jgi:hypothetical protein